MVVSSKAIKLLAAHDGQSVDELREDMASRLQVILNNFAKAASRICRRRTSAPRPSRRTASMKASQCTIGEGGLVELWKR
jgi:hypothetical protein